jgi:hypothetical protein
MVNAGQINAGVAILPYPKGDRATADAIAHNDVVELYYVLLGEATMNTGGTIHHVHRVCGRQRSRTGGRSQPKRQGIGKYCEPQDRTRRRDNSKAVGSGPPLALFESDLLPNYFRQVFQNLVVLQKQGLDLIQLAFNAVAIGLHLPDRAVRLWNYESME